MGAIRYHHHDANPFFATVKARSEAWMKATGRTRYGGWRIYLKSAFWLGTYFGLYSLLLFGLVPFPYSLLVWAGFGFAMLLISLNIGHDASHGSFSSNSKVNAVFSYVFELIGTSSYLWGIMHNKAHHGFVNLHVNDVAIQTEPMLRLSPDAPLYSWHRWQHLYAFPLYSISTLFWVLLKDFKFISKQKIGPFKGAPHPWYQYVLLVGTKLIYFGYIIVLPVMFSGASLWEILLGFLIMHLTMGITLGLTFQTTHAVEETCDPKWAKAGEIDNTWAVHVLESTSDFKTDSKLLNFLYGGLNSHVAHHIYPNISHVHYPGISKIIKEVAEELDLVYIENPNMWAAALSHIQYLKQLGDPKTARMGSMPAVSPIHNT